MFVYWIRFWSTFDCQHSTQEGGRLEDSIPLQQKRVQLSASHSHYEMCSWHVPPQVGLCERAILGRPRLSRGATIGLLTCYHSSQVPQFDTHTRTAITHLHNTPIPSLPSTGLLSLAEQEGTRSLVAFSRDCAVIGFNCRSTARATRLACNGSR